MENKEYWKDVKGYEGKYQVSNLGNVKSLNYRRTGREQLLKPVLKGNGYYFIYLCTEEGRLKFEYVHRLVAAAFIENSEQFPCVNHKDEDRQNNEAINLEWCTYKSNNNWGSRNQKLSESKKGVKFSELHKQHLSEAKKRYWAEKRTREK